MNDLDKQRKKKAAEFFNQTDSLPTTILAVPFDTKLNKGHGMDYLQVSFTNPNSRLDFNNTEDPDTSVALDFFSERIKRALDAAGFDHLNSHTDKNTVYRYVRTDGSAAGASMLLQGEMPDVKIDFSEISPSCPRPGKRLRVGEYFRMNYGY
jgi:hypothetical protein